ncbi:alpha/beta fold hydrolase (plasmid) [Pseudoalteromonas sp. T1lg65]|uniref:alpha/beta fold hydrolase n=1 Tax=Pseudoalteromonas sp. T1lg65 TaxID=2077101 RepID=UPI003F7A9442
MHNFEINNNKVGPFAFQQWGNGENYIVYLHGWQDNSNSFQPLQPYTDENYTHIALDFLGHGWSDWRSEDAHYYFVDYVYDLKCFLDTLGISHCHLVGHSLGAMVANLFASCYPSYCQTLSLIEGIGIVCTEENETKSQLINAFTSRDRYQQTTRRTFTNIEELVELRRKVSDFDLSVARCLMERGSDKCDVGVTLNSDPRLKHHSGFRYSKAQAINALETITTPTLLVFGSRGYQLIEKQRKIFSGCFNDLSVQEIVGGHHCHMENPEACYKLINAHIKRSY